MPVWLPLLTGLSILASGCSATGASKDFIECAEPRPEVCTMDYTPVCAWLSVSGTAQWKTYSNACSACADSAVSGYRKDSCPSDR